MVSCDLSNKSDVNQAFKGAYGVFGVTTPTWGAVDEKEFEHGSNCSEQWCATLCIQIIGGCSESYQWSLWCTSFHCQEQGWIIGKKELNSCHFICLSTILCREHSIHDVQDESGQFDCCNLCRCWSFQKDSSFFCERLLLLKSSLTQNNTTNKRYLLQVIM